MSGERYQLWSNGQVLARYKTLGQALLGAQWRSRKRCEPVYVWTDKVCVAVVSAIPEAAVG